MSTARAPDGCRSRRSRPRTCWSSPRCRPTPVRATRSCAASTRRTSSSTSGPRSSRTARGGPGPASTSPTSRRCTASRSARPRSGRCSATARPTVVLDRDDGGRLWIFEDTPRLSTYVVVVNAGPVPRAARAARRPQPRPLLPAVAAALPRAGRRGAVPGHRAGAGVLRRAVRASPSRRSATTRSSCPTSAARWRTGAASPGPTACCYRTPPTHASELRSPRPAARDGAHVVRRPGDDALVGRPVAQRGVRLVRLHVGAVSATEFTDALGHLPRGRADRRLPAGPGAGQPPDPHRRARRRPRLRELRRDHLLQGRRRSCTS